MRAPLAQPPFCGKCGEKFGGRMSRINHEKTCPGSSPFLRSASNKRDPLAANSSPKQSITRRSRAAAAEQGQQRINDEQQLQQSAGAENRDDAGSSLEDVVVKDLVFPIDRITDDDDDHGDDVIGIVGGLE
jgi:hypothetical protein